MEKLGNYILDIAAGPFGSNLKVECFVPTGFPIIDGANLKSFKVTDNISKFVTEEKARSLHRSIAQKNDVIVTISGNVGQISYIPEDSKYEEYLVSQRQFRVTFDTTRIYIPFLVYYFHTKEGQHKILSFANQTGVPALAQPLKNFRNIDVAIPDIVIQKKIANILESIDDKIENNKQINDNLEQQAQTLYKSWFIDNYQTEWPEYSLDEVTLKITDGVHNTVIDTPNGEYYLLSCKNIKNRRLHMSSSERRIDKGTFDKLRRRTMLSRGDILLSSVGTIGELMLLNEDPHNFEFQRSVAIIKPNPEYISSYYLYETLISQIDKITNTAHGAVQQCIFLSDLKEYTINIPEKTLISRYDIIVKPFFDEISKREKENTRLTLLRNSLLPKLMSGELKINEIDC